jgi:hypothetical protein
VRRTAKGWHKGPCCQQNGCVRLPSPSLPTVAGAAGWNFQGRGVLMGDHEHNTKEQKMPVLLWLLGVPLSLVLILMLAGVVHF